MSENVDVRDAILRLAAQDERREKVYQALVTHLGPPPNSSAEVKYEAICDAVMILVGEAVVDTVMSGMTKASPAAPGEARPVEIEAGPAPRDECDTDAVLATRVRMAIAELHRVIRRCLDADLEVQTLNHTDEPWTRNTELVADITRRL